MNTAARLHSEAQAGEIVLSAEIHAEAGGAIPEARPISLALKGKAHALRGAPGAHGIPGMTRAPAREATLEGSAG